MNIQIWQMESIAALSSTLIVQIKSNNLNILLIITYYGGKHYKERQCFLKGHNEIVFLWFMYKFKIVGKQKYSFKYCIHLTLTRHNKYINI